MNPPITNPVSIPHSMLVFSLGNSAADVYCSATTMAPTTISAIKNLELCAGRRCEGRLAGSVFNIQNSIRKTLIFGSAQPADKAYSSGLLFCGGQLRAKSYGPP